MLSDRERRELDAIERGLAADDPPFVDAFHRGRSGHGRRRRHWPSRLLIGTGALMLVVGIVAGVDTLFLQGLLLGVVGLGWSSWRARRWTDPRPWSGWLPGPRPKPGTPPPEWRRPG